MSEGEAIPSAEQLVLLYRVFIAFTSAAELVSTSARSYDEDRVLPPYLKLADVLRPLRGLLGQFRGWPAPIGAAVATLIEVFDRYTSAVGWEALADPERRAGHIKRCWAKFFETYERPLYEAALSVERDLGLAEPPDGDLARLAGRGRALGLGEPFAADEALAAYLARKAEYRAALRFGRPPAPLREIIPELGQEGSAIGRALAILRDAVVRATGGFPGAWHPEEDRPAGPAEPELIEQAAKSLTPASAELLRFLAQRPGRKASFLELARRRLSGQREPTKDRVNAQRRPCERLRKALNLKGGRVRLHIASCSAQIIINKS